MKFSNVLIILLVPILASCTGRDNTPGYIFEIIFIVIPILIIGHYLHKKIETANESLYIVEGQIKRLLTKLEKLEESIDKISESNSKKRTRK